MSGTLSEFTEPEAAERLRVSPRFLRGERSAGRIGYVQRGRKVLYSAAGIEAYRRSQETRRVDQDAMPIAIRSRGVRGAGRRALMVD